MARPSGVFLGRPRKFLAKKIGPGVCVFFGSRFRWERVRALSGYWGHGNGRGEGVQGHVDRDRTAFVAIGFNFGLGLDRVLSRRYRFAMNGQPTV